MSARSDLSMLLRLYRSRLRLAASAALGDPVAGVLGVPRGGDGYARYEQIRARGDLVRGSSGLCMTASHAVCSHVLRSEKFLAAPTSAVRLKLRPLNWQHGGMLVHPLDDSLASANPPEHTSLRKVVAPWFSPEVIRGHRGFIEDVVAGQLDQLDPSGPVDLIDEFAIQVPSKVICALLGLSPHDHFRFARWGIEFGATVDGARGLRDRHRTQLLLAEMTDYFAAVIAQRSRHPGDDMISTMVTAVAQGHMTEVQLLATCQALLIGGFVTTSNIIGNAVVALSENPDQREAFTANLDRADHVVEETLRLQAPAQYSVRVAGETTVLVDLELRAGTPVVALLAAANRDPTVFVEPNRFDIGRPNARDHLSFAAGVHYCLGASLARMEGAIALRALYERFPRLTAAGAVDYVPSRVIRGPLHLPVRCG
ncbi:cytochrome P450 [Mycobacterium attenuatum]|uniref:cytochrome P450 n=1 Tax=Mycobacterium attenuatum TaxID=2341086 RepID=UPI000F151537|nr:cytochrome P450 [Mycobacterium attenuatum]VBA58938.1 Putative cytochrome P450 140 [Mycobacterium attenuatum]